MQLWRMAWGKSERITLAKNCQFTYYNTFELTQIKWAVANAGHNFFYQLEFMPQHAGVDFEIDTSPPSPFHT